MTTVEPVYDLLTLVWAFAVGAAAGVLYEVLKAFRLSFDLSRITVFALDMLFWLMSAVAVFCLLLVRCRGDVRWFAVAGAAAGFAVWRALFGRWLLKILVLLLKTVKTVTGFIYNKVNLPIFTFILTVFRKISRGLLSILGNCAIKLKKRLQVECRLLYNDFRKYSINKGRFVDGRRKRAKKAPTGSLHEGRQSSGAEEHKEKIRQ